MQEKNTKAVFDAWVARYIVNTRALNRARGAKWFAERFNAYLVSQGGDALAHTRSAREVSWLLVRCPHLEAWGYQNDMPSRGVVYWHKACEI